MASRLPLWRLFALPLLLSHADPRSVRAEDAPTQSLSPLQSENRMSEAGPYVSAGLDRKTLRDTRVVRAMSRVPRHKFVPADIAERAYEDRALPIGSGQTISQPFIVALMTQEAGVVPGAKVLEIGTGSGFQAAVLAELGANVFSIEIVPELAEQARTRLKELGYSSVAVRQGDGWKGWKEEAPFDAILVTAAAPKPPMELIQQLADGGRMVVPIEQSDDGDEHLMVVERHGNDLVTRNLGTVKFVPVTGIAREELDDEPEDPLLDALGIEKKP